MEEWELKIIKRKVAKERNSESGNIEGNTSKADCKYWKNEK